MIAACSLSLTLAIIPLFLQVVEDGYEFFARRQLVTLFSAPNYCGEFDNAGGMMTVDDSLMCSFQVSRHRSACFFPIYLISFFPFADIETIREEGQVFVQRHELIATHNTATQRPNVGDQQEEIIYPSASISLKVKPKKKTTNNKIEKQTKKRKLK